MRHYFCRNSQLVSGSDHSPVTNILLFSTYAETAGGQFLCKFVCEISVPVLLVRDEIAHNFITLNFKEKELAKARVFLKLEN